MRSFICVYLGIINDIYQGIGGMHNDSKYDEHVTKVSISFIVYRLRIRKEETYRPILLLPTSSRIHRVCRSYYSTFLTLEIFKFGENSYYFRP